MIPQANPRAQYDSHRAEIDQAIARVLDKGRYILGEETAAFEREFAAYIGVRFGSGVGSGTEALHLALRACGDRPALRPLPDAAGDSLPGLRALGSGGLRGSS